MSNLLSHEEMLLLTTQRLLDTPKSSELMVRYPNACKEILAEEWVIYSDFFTWKLDNSFYGGVDSLLVAAILWLDSNRFSECIDGDKEEHVHAEELWVSVLHEEGAMVERFLKVIERELEK